MIARFCLYSVLKNLRFADPFLVLFLRSLGLSFTEIGTMLGFQHLLTAVIELPLGVVADRLGRRSALAACFLFYTLAFATFAQVSSPDLPLLYAALGSFGLAEGLRTGSHKAIILDYLDGTDQSDRTTRVIGLTRSFSKFSSAFAALCGGAVLYFTHAYSALFWMSAVSSTAGLGLMLSYPRSLEGEQVRSREGGAGATEDGWLSRFKMLVSHPGTVLLLAQSTLFESQVKLILKYYLQPLLKQALALAGIPILGAGALYIGAVEATRDTVGGGAALASHRIRALFGSTSRALRGLYLAGTLCAVGIAATAAFNLLIPAIALLVLITAIQNIRRPIFVQAFNQVMDKPQRATALSLESLTRSVVVALMLPCTGMLADQYGLWAALTAVCLLLVPGVLLTPRK